MPLATEKNAKKPKTKPINQPKTKKPKQNQLQNTLTLKFTLMGGGVWQVFFAGKPTLVLIVLGGGDIGLQKTSHFLDLM